MKIEILKVNNKISFEVQIKTGLLTTEKVLTGMDYMSVIG
jgi:nitroimidazol reductase NimA-like FMN-containing flavoprotein (pyridoxamine 5'-phosphate oxidase superfamily)